MRRAAPASPERPRIVAATDVAGDPSLWLKALRAVSRQAETSYPGLQVAGWDRSWRQ